MSALISSRVSCPLASRKQRSITSSPSRLFGASWRDPEPRPAALATPDCLQSLRSHRGRLVVPQGVSGEAVTVAIPQSQEQAVQEACATLILHMKPLLNKENRNAKRATKSFSPKSKKALDLFAIEIPVASDSVASTSALAVEVAGQLAVMKASLTVVFADKAAAIAAKGSSSLSGTDVLSLQEACRGKSLGGALLVVAPKVADVALVEQLLQEVWVGGAPAALLNAEFPSAAVPSQYKGLCDDILVVWSLLPIALGGLMGGKEGAVLRVVDKIGSAAKDCTWRILFKQPGDKFVACGQTKQRPRNEDLELAFLNASAALSPATSAVKAIKSLIPNFNFGKK